MQKEKKKAEKAEIYDNFFLRFQSGGTEHHYGEISTGTVY